jgi:hypothetical protein
MVLNVRGIYETIERNTPERIKELGRAAIFKFGCSQAIDNTVERQHEDELRRFDIVEAGLIFEDASDEALGEIAALRRFVATHGPTTQAEIDLIEITAEPEPLALKVLERIMDEEIPNPPPPPHIPQARRASN